jgi:hypothetical protein
LLKNVSFLNEHLSFFQKEVDEIMPNRIFEDFDISQIRFYVPGERSNHRFPTGDAFLFLALFHALFSNEDFYKNDVNLTVLEKDNSGFQQLHSALAFESIAAQEKQSDRDSTKTVATYHYLNCNSLGKKNLIPALLLLGLLWQKRFPKKALKLERLEIIKIIHPKQFDISFRKVFLDENFREVVGGRIQEDQLQIGMVKKEKAIILGDRTVMFRCPNNDEMSLLYELAYKKSQSLYKKFSLKKLDFQKIIWRDLFNYLEEKGVFTHTPLLKSCLEKNIEESSRMVKIVQDLYRNKQIMCPMVSLQKIEHAVTGSEIIQQKNRNLILFSLLLLFFRKNFTEQLNPDIFEEMLFSLNNGNSKYVNISFSWKEYSEITGLNNKKLRIDLQ